MRLPRWFWDQAPYMQGCPSGKGIIASVVVILVALFSVGVSATTIDERNACNYAQRSYHRDTVWNFWRGCYIDTGRGQRVPLDQYKIVVQGR